MYARHLAHRARLFMPFLLLASTLLTACDSNPTPTPLPQSPDPTAIPDNTSEQPLATPTAEPPAAPTSLSKITEAEQAGKIDHNTALLYQLYSYFDRASLPTEYLGDDSNTVAEASEILT